MFLAPRKGNYDLFSLPNFILLTRIIRSYKIRRKFIFHGVEIDYGQCNKNIGSKPTRAPSWHRVTVMNKKRHVPPCGKLQRPLGVNKCPQQILFVTCSCNYILLNFFMTQLIHQYWNLIKSSKRKEIITYLIQYLTVSCNRVFVYIYNSLMCKITLVKVTRPKWPHVPFIY